MRYSVDWMFNYDTNGFHYEIRQYRNPSNVIKRGYLPWIDIEANGFLSIREYILCYGLDD